MRRTDRDDSMHTGVGPMGGHPCTHGQPSHAVRHDDRRQSRGRFHAVHCRLHPIGITVDGAKHGFEIDCDERHAACAQLLHQWVPNAAVAREAVHQHHAPAPATSRQEIRLDHGAKGLAPAEHPWRHQHLAPPCLGKLPRRRPGR